jgi:hypothetical protein
MGERQRELAFDFNRSLRVGRADHQLSSSGRALLLREVDELDTREVNFVGRLRSSDLLIRRELTSSIKPPPMPGTKTEAATDRVRAASGRPVR